MSDCGCEVPCWSGLWLETNGQGFMEISDLDERHHRPPAGWTLDTVSVNVLRSSQIFRYVPAEVLAAAHPLLLESVK